MAFGVLLVVLLLALVAGKPVEGFSAHNYSLALKVLGHLGDKMYSRVPNGRHG